MAQVAGHLSVEELQACYRESANAVLARHYQVIWLLAQGRSCAEVARLTSFARRWVEQLLERYNAFGRGSLGDRRRKNGAAPTVLTPEVLANLEQRLKTLPDDGGVWTAKKVAAFMAAELRRRVSEQRGWEALRAIGWTIRRPRPSHARAASPEEQAAFKTYGPPRLQADSRDAAVSVCANVSGIGASLPAQMELRASRSSQNSRRRLRHILNQGCRTRFDFQAISVTTCRSFGPCALAPAVFETQARAARRS
jgi:transposase